MAKARGRYLGMDLEIISVDEAAKLFPLMDKKHFKGAMYDPIEGHVDPYGVTHAYAKSAQIGGAEIVRQTRVTDLKRRPDGTWDVITEHGNVHAEHVVNAGGLWAREVGRMVGLELPVLAMEHQYLITGDMPELAGKPEQLHCIDFEGEIYIRQERGGMLMGTYERAGVPWSDRDTPWDFGQDLLPNDLERIAPSLEVGFEHFPSLGGAGIRKVVNGPFTFAPDGNPLVGPVRGLRNYWVACGVMAGFSQGGGVGLSLAHWMVDGDPGADVWAMDVARYGDWATLAYTNAKVRENYSRRFRIRFPNEELPAARPLRTTPIYEKLQAQHAVFGDYCGFEHSLWFAPTAAEAADRVSFRRSNAHEHVGAECRAVERSVGLLEISNYGKFEVRGPGAAAWLSRMMANRVPKVGRIALTPMLNDRGKLIGDFTMCRIAEDHFFLVGTYAAEMFYMRWFERHLPPSGVSVRPCAVEYVGLSVAGPHSRALLQTLVRADLSTAAFPFMSFSRMDVGMVPAFVGRVSFTGELGYEIWVTTDYQRALYDLLTKAGREFGLKHFGGRALNCPAHREELRELGAGIPADLRAASRRDSAASSISTRASSSVAGRGARREGERRRVAARELHGRGCGRRRARRRADLARRQSGRLGDVGCLRASVRGARWRSATCRRRWPRPTADSRSKSSASAAAAMPLGGAAIDPPGARMRG